MGDLKIMVKDGWRVMELDTADVDGGWPRHVVTSESAARRARPCSSPVSARLTHASRAGHRSRASASVAGAAAGRWVEWRGGKEGRWVAYTKGANVTGRDKMGLGQPSSDSSLSSCNT